VVNKKFKRCNDDDDPCKIRGGEAEAAHLFGYPASDTSINGNSDEHLLYDVNHKNDHE
jgi:hypothetical protein